MAAATSPSRTPPARTLAPHTKIVAAVLFVIVVVATPWRAWPAFAGHAVLLVAVAVLARVPARWLVPRLALGAPVLVFAAAVAFVAVGDRIAVGPLAVSRQGLEGGGLMLAGATLGLASALLLAATTPAEDVLAGLRRLGLPATLVNQVAFMMRFGEVVGSEATNLRRARQARGGGLNRWRDWVATTHGLGVLFLRSYARADRIDRALIARGWCGETALVTAGPAARVGAWAIALSLPMAGALVTAATLAAVGR